MDKKGGIGIVILVIVIIIGLGVGAYFIFFFNKDPLQRSNFPEEISSYKLKEFKIDKHDCGEINGEEVCVDFARIEYVSETENKMIHVMPSYVIKGRESYEDYFKQNKQLSNGFYVHSEEWELTWISKKYVFTTQEYSYSKNDDGSIDSFPNTADRNNAVVQYFYNKYPPVE